MAVSKVVLGDETLIDLTGDSVSSENLLQGATAHAANGEQITGGVVVTPMYTGTKAAIEEAIALGQIPEDAVVNITDDEETSSFQTQINEINSSLSENTAFPDYTNIVKSGAITDWVATEDIYFESLYCEYYGSTISTDYRVKVNNTYVGAKNSASISPSTLYISTSHGYAKKGDVISCKTSTFVAYGLKK